MDFFKKLVSLFNTSSGSTRLRIFFILGGLILVNILVWILTFIYAQQYSFLLGFVTLAYGLGLRHAVDADHIAAIDNTTRKLVNDGQKPIGVGLFFSLGHSTIVILLSVGIAFFSSYISTNMTAFKEIGSLIGISVSAFFLIFMGVINLIVFLSTFKIWQHVTAGKHYHKEHIDEHMHNRGLIARILNPLIRSIRHSWSMYFVGILFGLGFDTASEVGLLSLSALSSSKGLPIMALLLMPLAFTAGMALVDTLDGILMIGAYGWANINPIRKLYYNLIITFISVVIALFIGGIETLQIVNRLSKGAYPLLGFADSISLEYVGYIIIGIFIIGWIGSVLLYKFSNLNKLEESVHTHKK